MSALSACYLFLVSIQVCFSSISVYQSAQRRIELVFIRNIGHQTLPKIWVGTFFERNVQTDQGKDFELILTVKVKTRHRVEGQSGSEFPAICNHCGVMAQDLEILLAFLRFFWKNDPLWQKL